MTVYVGEDQNWALRQQQARQEAWSRLAQAMDYANRQRSADAENTLKVIASTPGGMDSSLAHDFAQNYGSDPALMMQFQALQNQHDLSSRYWNAVDQGRSTYDQQASDVSQAQAAYPAIAAVAAGIPGGASLSGAAQIANDAGTYGAGYLAGQDPSGMTQAFSSLSPQDRAGMVGILHDAGLPISRVLPQRLTYQDVTPQEAAIMAYAPQYAQQTAMQQGGIVPDAGKIATSSGEAWAKVNPTLATEAGKTPILVNRAKEMVPVNAEQAAATAQATSGIPLRTKPGGGEKSLPYNTQIKNTAEEILTALPDQAPPQPPQPTEGGFIPKAEKDRASRDAAAYKAQVTADRNFAKDAAQAVVELRRLKPDSQVNAPDLLNRLKAAVDAGMPEPEARKRLLQSLQQTIRALRGY